MNKRVCKFIFGMALWIKIRVTGNFIHINLSNTVMSTLQTLCITEKLYWYLCETSNCEKEKLRVVQLDPDKLFSVICFKSISNLKPLTSIRHIRHSFVNLSKSCLLLVIHTLGTSTVGRCYRKESMRRTCGQNSKLFRRIGYLGKIK